MTVRNPTNQDHGLAATSNRGWLTPSEVRARENWPNDFPFHAIAWADPHQAGARVLWSQYEPARHHA